MKNKIFPLFITGCLGLSTQQLFANCTTPNDSIALGPVSSFNVPSLNSTENQISGGLSCTGALTLLTTQYIQYTALELPSALLHTNGKNSAKITILDYDKNVVNSSVTRDLSRFVAISLFSGPNSSIPFYIKVNENTNLIPGTYNGHFKVRWYWSIPYLGLLGVALYHRSPNLQATPLTGVVTDWGTGQDATLNIKLTVEKDCNINAQNINFGTAPLTSKFDPVTGTINVTCSAGTPYKVNLSDGQNYNQTRRMKNVNSTNFISYEVYKNTSTQRWGNSNVDNWSSDTASQNAGIYDGSITQGYAYTAKIIDNSSNASVEGSYADNLILEVVF